MKILIVNWGNHRSKYTIGEAHKIFGDNLYIATTKDIPEEISSIFKQRNVIITNPYDVMSLCEDVSSYCIKNNISFDIVTTFFELNVYHTAFLADYLGIKKRLPLKAALKTSSNKYIMRNFFLKHEIFQPKFILFSENDIYKIYSKIKKDKNKKYVLKPAISAKSFGVRYIESRITKTAFKKTIQESKSEVLFDDNDSEWRNYLNRNEMKFILEEFIPGNVFSFDGIVKNIGNIKFIGNTEFETCEPPRLDQVGQTIPIASLTKEQISICKRFVKKNIKLLELQYCGFHCELKFYKNKPCLIEIAGRLPGSSVLIEYQRISKQNIFLEFFSIFNDKLLSHQQIKKTPKYSSIAFYSSFLKSKRKEMVLEKLITPNIKTNKKNVDVILCSYEGHSLYKTSGYIYNYFLLFDLVLRSKTMTSKELNKIKNKLIKQMEFKISKPNIIKENNYFKTISERILKKLPWGN